MQPWAEDPGAIASRGIAAVGLTLTAVTGDGAWDAIASIAIGVLLMVISGEKTPGR